MNRITEKIRCFNVEYRTTIAICCRKNELPVGADDASEMIFLSIKIDVAVNLTNLYKMNMIKCSLGCTLF